MAVVVVAGGDGGDNDGGGADAARGDVGDVDGQCDGDGHGNDGDDDGDGSWDGDDNGDDGREMVIKLTTSIRINVCQQMHHFPRKIILSVPTFQTASTFYFIM